MYDQEFKINEEQTLTSKNRKKSTHNAIAKPPDNAYQRPAQLKQNNTGLPDNLKFGIENLSGYSMDDVKVHYNSDKPAQLQAHAYAQGTDIHLAPGQEKHLPHEAWHVIQQKQGRVKPTVQMKAKVYVNCDEDLEKEADIMGSRANHFNNIVSEFINDNPRKWKQHSNVGQTQVAQAFFSDGPSKIEDVETFLKPGISIINKIYENNRKKRAVLIDYITRAKSEVNEGTSQDFIKYHKANMELNLDEKMTNAIKAVIGKPDELDDMMDVDETGGGHVVPVQQLSECLKACKDLPAEEAAIYLYTTYFYGPFNKFLRQSKEAEEVDGGKYGPNFQLPNDQMIDNISPAMKELMWTTHLLLTRAFQIAPKKKLESNVRMELQPSWINKRENANRLVFPGFTSTHPDLDGVNNMWSDIENGTFGELEGKLALLVFEGESKVLRPKTKYFKTEIEDILPSGMETKIVKNYETKWTDDDGNTCTVDVYHLMIQNLHREEALALESEIAASDVEYRFNEDGYIERIGGGA